MSETVKSGNSLLSYKKGRSAGLDVLKAIAIFAVILYHAGVLRLGYLGVDVFLVVNGFLVMSSIIRRREKGEKFSYFSFLWDKILAFWPLVLIACAVCLAVGYFSMLPDDLENLAESVIASNVFANNILSAITTKNYWDVANDFKPLMHTWYISLLMQCYVVIPFIVKLCTKAKNFRKSCGIVFSAATVLSFVLFILPIFSSSDKFYFPFFRFFEVSLGAVIALYADKIREKISSIKIAVPILSAIALAIFSAIISLIFPSVENTVYVTAVCLLTAAFIIIDMTANSENEPPLPVRIIAMFGKLTFGLYIWHQIILAFVRYTVKTDFSFFEILLYIIFTSFIAFVSYFIIEKPIAKVLKNKKGKIIISVACIVLCAVTSLFSLLLYKNAGVVRDIPELDIKKSEAHRNMHAEYCDRGYSYNKDFSDLSKTNVIVIGDSFGRDFVNILLESSLSDGLEISYIFPHSVEYVTSFTSRFENADRIVYAVSNVKSSGIPAYLDSYYEKGIVTVVGNKSFGQCNGIIYGRRNADDYFSSSARIADEFITQNDMLKEKYQGHYIDMIAPVISGEKDRVKVFTEDGKFISQDTRHLTRSGAVFYSKLLDLSDFS